MSRRQPFEQPSSQPDIPPRPGHHRRSPNNPSTRSTSRRTQATVPGCLSYYPLFYCITPWCTRVHLCTYSSTMVHVYSNTRLPLRREVAVRRRKPPSRARSRGTGRPSRTCHQPPHQVRGAGLRIIRLDGPHSAEAGQRVGAAGFARFAGGPAPDTRSRRKIQYWNSVCPSPRTWMMGGHPSVVKIQLDGRSCVVHKL